MESNKYLLKRGDVSYTNFVFPRGIEDKDLAGKRCRIALGTDEKMARHVRDKYIIPLLEEGNELHVLEMMILFYTQKKKALQDKLAELLPELGLKNCEAYEMTLTSLCQRYEEHMKAYTELEKTSISRYQSILKSFCHICGGDSRVLEISSESIKHYLDESRELPINWQVMHPDTLMEKMNDASRKKISHSTLKDHLTLLDSMFTWAIEKEKILPSSFSNPVSSFKGYFKNIKTRKKRKPEVEEVEKLLNMPLPKSEHIDETAWRLIPKIASCTGMRAGEISMLSAEDVVFEKGVRCFNVRDKTEKDLKNDSSNRLVPICDRLLPDIDQLLAKVKTGRLFKHCGDYSKDGIFRPGHYFKKCFQRYARKHVAKDLAMHNFRTYVNDWMTEGGADIIDRERILGHKNHRTQSAYVSSELKRYKTALDAVP